MGITMKNINCQNTASDFEKFCHFHGIILKPAQKKIVEEIFNMPSAGGKSLLICLLYKYNPSSNEYLEKDFNNIHSVQY